MYKRQGPNIIIDDGGDLVNLLHTEYPEKIKDVIGGCEETTTGILRLLAMDQAGELKFPMVLVLSLIHIFPSPLFSQ